MLWLQIQKIFSCFKVACGHSRLASLPPPSRLYSQASFSAEQTFFFHISVADWKNWDGPPIEFAASLMSMSLMKEALSHQSSNKIGYHVFISRFFPYPPWVTGFRVYCPSGTVPGIIVGWTRLWLKTSKVTSLCTASPLKQKPESLVEGRERPWLAKVSTLLLVSDTLYFCCIYEGGFIENCSELVLPPRDFALWYGKKGFSLWPSIINPSLTKLVLTQKKKILPISSFT